VVAVGWPPGSGAPGEPAGAPGEHPEDQYGRGERDPVTGLYEWYEFPEQIRRQRAGEAVPWETLLTHWSLIEADLHSEYDIDVEDRQLMRHRSWRWLETRIVGLLAADTRLHRALAPPPEVPGLPQ
jgi:hypothetical protein